MKSTTEQVLKQEHIDAGLYLEEDDHNVILYGKHGIIVAPFTIYATKETIREVADYYLEGWSWQ